jgi:DNA-binding NtrC family response regulator
VRFAQEIGVEPPEISPETLERMVEYAWPGNVRELENYIERAVIMYTGARTIPFDMPLHNGAHSERDLAQEAKHERWDLARLEREYILEVLHDAGGHRGHAAEILGIDRRTLYRAQAVPGGRRVPGGCGGAVLARTPCSGSGGPRQNGRSVGVAGARP